MESAVAEPYPLPSLPASPIEPIEQDVLSSEITPQQPDNLSPSKGKGRLTDSPTPYDDDQTEVADVSSEEEEEDAKVNEEEARKIEENLKQWELTERQRRKAARESTYAGSSGSLVGDVTRRASLLWSGRKGQRPSSGLGSHRAVRTHESEDGVPLEELDSSPMNSPEPSLAHQSFANLENPFEDSANIRSGSTTSLNTPGQSALMSESSEPPMLQPPEVSSSSNPKRHHPPPEPLDLPRPRSPPPRSETQHTNKPPDPIPSPSAMAPIPVEDDGHLNEMPETRWWTDWLCGCNEGPNRGGDHQAGRTNPFA